MTNAPGLTRENNPGNARWCTEHPDIHGSRGGRLECTKQKSRGRGICHSQAIRGTDACSIHGGGRRDVLKAKGEARITAWKATGSGAGSVSSSMAVLGVLQMSWLRLAAYSELLRQQVIKDGGVIEQDGTPVEGSELSGLIGHRYGAAGRDGHIYAVSEEARALVGLESAERDRVVKYAKTAHDMGISDRLTNLAERWGDVVATRITLMLDALDLSPEQAEKVPALITAHLGSIDTDTIGSDKK